MLLVLDVGNTNIKTGIFDNGLLFQSWRLTTDVRRTSDEYGIQMESFFDHIGIPTSAITGVIMSSVNPLINYTIEHMCRLFFHELEPLIVNCDIKTGLVNCYDQPQKLGSDRVCNSVGAFHKYGGPCVVIDFGTATSFNVISKKAEFLGGLICPGIKVSVEALTNSTALLPSIQYSKPDHVIGRNTVDSIQSGIIHGYSGMVKNIISMIDDERGEKHKVIATGGMSTMIANETNLIDAIDPTLTLEGLSIIAKLNGLDN